MGRQHSLRSDDRGVSSVVGKVLAIGISLLYIGAMTTLVFGSVVPEYRTATGQEMGDRVLATAAGSIEQAPPAVGGTVEAATAVELPATIRDSGYRLTVSGRTLELDHPDGISAETRLSLPDDMTVQDGSWNSGGELLVAVSGPAGDRTLSIEEGP